MHTIRRLFRSPYSRPAPSIIGWILFICLCLSHGSSFAALPHNITALKDLHINTTLVEKGLAEAVLVIPDSGRYQASARAVHSRIRELTGIGIPVYLDNVAPEKLLKTQNVIALGNMATNAFIEKLYRQWYVILDLTYPGAGGYVVRSLHNPYGTGHNVILLGGADDPGVAEAARIFCEELQKAEPLKVGWLLKVRLGRDLAPPVIDANSKDWQVFSWNDSWRKLLNGRTSGYPPSTFFGWSPVSIAGMLYYLTGNQDYLETFKKLALPDPQDVPLPNRASDAFTDPANPLVKSYHYRAHLLDCIYDLIEESPLFSDKERLAVTNKLLEHQIELDPKHTYSIPNGSRHDLWHMMCIFTGSRYFATYYPDPIWNRRLENVRRGFRSLLGNPTWGERDTLEWVSTSIEPVFDFFLMDGSEEFVDSGTAERMLKALEALMTGDEVDSYNQCLALNLLHQGAYLLGDGRYIWMARQLGFDLKTFRIGQSYWPSPLLAVQPPDDLVNRVAVVPVARSDREKAGSPVSPEEGFQYLAFRTGLTKNDDYLAIDGFEGLGSHPYQLNTLYRLRMFGGMNILSGYGNDLAVTMDGLNGAHVARSAALKQTFVAGEMAYLQTEVPDMPGSGWHRHLLYLKDRLVVVLDSVKAHQDGRYDLTAYWQTAAGINGKDSTARQVSTRNGAALVSANWPMERLSDHLVQIRTSRELRSGEDITLASLFFQNSQPKTMRPVKGGGYLISGTLTGYLTERVPPEGNLSGEADFVYLDQDRLLVANGKKLAMRGRQLINAEENVSLLWNLNTNQLSIVARQATSLELAGKTGPVMVQLSPGETRYDGNATLAALKPEVQTFLRTCEPEPATVERAMSESVGQPNWQPVWERVVPGKVVHLASGTDGTVWVGSQSKEQAHLTRIAANGTVLAATKREGELLSLWGESNKERERFMALAGFGDDTVSAYDKGGREVWRFTTQIHPTFIVGDHYDAPWFTDPRPPYNKRGVYAISVADFWGDGTDQIAVGRPCTVEFHRLDGSLIGRVPTRWGTNTALAHLENTNYFGQKRVVLAGKANAGNPRLSGINASLTNFSDEWFSGLLPGYLDMHAWSQRGTRHLFVEDLDGSGDKKVIYTLSGHWNELRVYNGLTGKHLWIQYLGPDKRSGVPFVSAATIVDLKGDGKKEIAVGTKSGWVLVFDAQGKPILRQHLSAPIVAMASRPGWRALAVACADGAIKLVDANGKFAKEGKFNGTPVDMVAQKGWLIIGDDQGKIRRYDVLR